MKILGKAIVLSFAFIAGVVAGGSACYLYFDRAENAEKAEEVRQQDDASRFMCRLNQDALYQRASLYRQEFGHWPTNVQDLVEAHFLSEYSQVHLCPSQIGGSGFGKTIYNQKPTFVEKNQKGAVGYYAFSPYRFGFDGTNFTVRCTVHTTNDHEVVAYQVARLCENSRSRKVFTSI
jgi:hypothetical protein